MYVIGTAGHVDHGKSTLVEALTGIDPDRLAEEKAREMTIDLGFAWLKLDEGKEVGVVDVPGHRDFIENMLAGIGGIDLALFVVAADEGVMPQTKEHLAILDLLEVRAGVIALTKSDLIDDPDWLELVTLDVSEAMAGTVLEQAPILPVSAKTGEGLAQLKAVLREQLNKAAPRPDLGRPRLPVDRVFSLSGFGTIVTGTLIDGRLKIGDPVEVQPSGLKGRVRGLQTHRTKLDTTQPGTRVAVNLTGVGRDQIKRGDIVAAPGVAGSTILIDAAYRHLPDVTTPLKHNMEVKLFAGAAEVLARTRVLGARQIEPGETGWLQLALDHPISVLRGDRFILRRPSPGATLGGGRVLDPFPGRRHRRFRPEVIERLETLAQGTPAELLLEAVRRQEPALRSQILAEPGLDRAVAEQLLAQSETDGQLVQIGQYLLSREGWHRLQERLTTILAAYHREFPLRPGMPREELRSRLRLEAAVFNPLITHAAEHRLLAEERTLLHLPGHQVTFSAKQQAAVNRLLQRMKTAAVNSPSVKECKAAVGEDVYFALVELGQLRPLSNEVVYRPEDFDRITREIMAYLQEHGRINVGQVRDLLATSRKYAISLLEYLDETKVTRRVGDNRELLQPDGGILKPPD
ncbi:MAG: selenocysteine-specific translation elongation factor [Anaerolineae bacterium]